MSKRVDGKEGNRKIDLASRSEEHALAASAETLPTAESRKRDFDRGHTNSNKRQQRARLDSVATTNVQSSGGATYSNEIHTNQERLAHAAPNLAAGLLQNDGALIGRTAAEPFSMSPRNPLAMGERYHSHLADAIARERDEIQRQQALLASLNHSRRDLDMDPTRSRRLLLDLLAAERERSNFTGEGRLLTEPQLPRTYASGVGQLPEYGDVYGRASPTDLEMERELLLHRLRLQQQQQQLQQDHRLWPPSSFGDVGSYETRPTPFSLTQDMERSRFLAQQHSQAELLSRLRRNEPTTSLPASIGVPSLRHFLSSAVFPEDSTIQPSLLVSEAAHASRRQPELSNARALDKGSLHQLSGEGKREESPISLTWPQPAEVMDDGYPRQLPALLAQAEDREKLSSHQVLLRHQIEAFQATQDDVATHTRGRNKPISLKQAKRSKGSTYFPASLVGLYQAAQNMSATHMQTGLCSEMPVSIKRRFADSIATKSSGSGAGRPYWAESARRLGLVDTDLGIFFVRDTQLSNLQVTEQSSGRQQQFTARGGQSQQRSGGVGKSEGTP